MPVLLQERRLLDVRRACSQIQKGPFFCLNTHASCSCGAKQIYIKIKYSSPHMPSILPTRFLSTPTPLPFRPQPTLPSPLLPELVHLLPCLLSPPTCSLVPPSTRQLARYSSNLFTCYPVSSRIQLINSSPHQLVNLQCYSSNLFICYPVSSRHQLVPLSTPQLVNLQCYSPNLFTCYHVY